MALAQQSAQPDPAMQLQLSRGKQFLQDRKFKEALDAFKDANKTQHNSCGECYFLIAVTYSRLHDGEHALENCDKAIAASADEQIHALAHNFKGNLLVAAAGKDPGKLKQADAEYEAAAKIFPKTALFHLNLAKVRLRESQDDAAKQELQACLDCSPEQKIADEARMLMAHPNRGREEMAPEFELTTMQGEHVTLQQLAGRVVVLDFWATWCPPCRESVPELKELTKKYPSDKLVLISVSADTDENAWRDFVSKKKMEWAQYRDSDLKLRNSFGIRAFPTYLVIDAEGVIKERITGLNPQQSVVHRLKAVLVDMPQLEGQARK